MNQALESLTGWIFGLPNVVHTVGGVVVLVLAGVLLNLFVKGRVVSLLSSLAERTSQQWDDIVLEHGVLDRLAQAVPALVVYFGVAWVPGLGESLSQVIANVAMAWLALAVTLAVGALLSAGTAIYETWPVARDRPIKGFVQVAQIAVYILGAIFVVSALMARSPVVLLTGFGAMTAILLLVFRDTILSLVASIQLTTLDMVRVGDWIEMPQYDADGDVVDIALHTIRVQNWDK
ncbi:MAG: mechanosensitive ion channel family protein, partial [Rhodospirillaceae bacterium]|nr:mechanosensitive ion channel family protein [Rhodospirillaceae bacterium]